MKVTLLPADRHGCGHYRLLYPMAAMSDEDVEFSVEEGIAAKRRRTVEKEVVGVEPIDADVVVMQRPLLRYLADCIPFIQAQGIAVVVDIDDDFTTLHHKHPAFWPTNPKTSPDSNWRHLLRACSIADMVTCSTPALVKRFGSRGNATLLRNLVPASYCSTRRSQQWNGVTVGWAGYTASHPDDLKATRGAVPEALTKHQKGTAQDARFLCVGDGLGVAEDLGFPPGQSRENFNITGPVELEKYPKQIGRFDVGIVPLQSTSFNEGKSYLKGLEYAALGVPFVASWTPEYEYLAAEGLGFIVPDRQRDWVRMLGYAMRHYEEMSKQYRELVKRNYTYEQHAWRWAEAWATAMQRRAQAAVPA